MQRSIIHIDEAKCDGCGLCIKACHEGALALVEGKARLVSEIYCDGLGACLGECPQGAIIIEKREAADFDEAAVAIRQKQLGIVAAAPVAPVAPAAPAPAAHQPHGGGGCPGSMARAFAPAAMTIQTTGQAPPSQLNHWPIQLRLLNAAAPFLQGADLLLCADCAPFAVPDFHARYLTNRSVAVSCPKLDDLDETIERLAGIIAQARPRRITVLRMEVPCCGGLVMAVRKALEMAAIPVPVEVHVIGVRGGIRTETLN